MASLVRVSGEKISLVDNNLEEFLTIRTGGQFFGIPVVKVRDVLKPLKVTKIPLSKREILGFMNLRGRIVTVVDLRTRLGQERAEDIKKQMFVVVEHDNDLFCIVVDEVGDCLELKLNEFEKNPENLNAAWKDVSRGIFKMENELMLVLDVAAVLKI